MTKNALYMTDFVASSAPSSNRFNPPVNGWMYVSFARRPFGSARTQAHIKAIVTIECSLSYFFLLSLHTYSVTHILPEPRSLLINVVNQIELTVNTQRPSARVTQVL